MKEEEKLFRESERRLDELMRRDEAAILAEGITITDWSARAYHYKNEHLSWSYWFEIKRARGRGGEIEKVSVTLSLYEHEPDSLRVKSGAEIFQIGQLSRWRDTKEEILSLDEAARRGLSNIVLEAIRAGKTAAAAV